MTEGRDLRGGHTVVVLSYRGREDTLRCVASVLAGSQAHVLVVDNGSGDGVLAEAVARWPQVTTLQTGTNLGFAGGMNAGLHRALDDGAAVVTVLNNDTVVDPGALDRLAERAASERVALSPEIRYLREPDQVWFAGARLDPHDGLPRHLDAGEATALRDRSDVPYVVDLLAGCCVTAGRDVWSAVGVFDERYFLDFEDSDWSVRARRAGVALEVDPGAVVRHAVSASFVGAYSYLGLYYYARNALLFARTSGRHPHRPRHAVQVARLLRHRLLPVPVRVARDRGPRTGLRHGVVLAAALGANAARRYGRAPARLERLADRWVKTPPTG
ncbi:glycosyltransferase family 2 protein [Isoptericola sp. NPDC057191]|uniref:glycosyltransferase family 2 protein n=1 Tax=Isoptericola sp. NPDC057191 TaxID=3346041 RepID=UPI003625C31F